MKYLGSLASPFVLSAALVAGPAHALTPLERSFAQLWALDYSGGPVCLELLPSSLSCPNNNTITGAAGAGMNLPQGWDLFTPSSREVVIALLDSGFDTSHPDLAGRAWVNTAELNAQGQCDVFRTDADGKRIQEDHDGNGYASDCYGASTLAKVGDLGAGLDGVTQLDTAGHGTQMSGAMVATANNLDEAYGGGVVGVAGLAPNVKVVTCAAFEIKTAADVSSLPTSTPVLAALPENVLKCARYFTALKDRGVNIVVVNVSGGVSKNANLGNVLSPVTKPEYLMDRADIRQAILDLKARDILVVASAGNFGWDIDNQINNSIPQANRAYYPASFEYDNVLSVAAVNIKQKLGTSSQSNWGRYSVDVAAPGDDIITTAPQAMGSYATVSGTSPAAAFVTGMVATIKANAATADLSAAAVRRLLLSSGQPLDALKHTTSSGKLVRLDAALACSGKAFTRRQLPAADAVTVAAGGALRMEVQNYVCANPGSAAALPVVDLISGATLFDLRDDGQGADQTAADGVYSGTWTPPSANQIYKLSFGTDTVTGATDVLTVNPDVQIVDNGQPVAGTWNTGVASAPAVGTYYLYTKQTTPVARQWSFTVQRTGRYKLSASWPIDKNGDLFATQAQYVIRSPGKPTIVVARDQRRGGGAWVELASVDLEAGTHTVTLKNTQHTDAEGDVETVVSTGQLVADGIRIDRESN